ncbi:MAG: hypothetical protein ACTSQJ_01925 [Promethearchaeota archaeon]
MSLILTYIEEWKLLFSLTAIIFGIQLGFYFFYQYYKIHSEKLHLNRILLAFGSFLIIAFVGAMLIAIPPYFLSENQLQENLLRLGYFITILGPIFFLYFITIEEFSSISPLKLNKILIIMLCIPLIAVIFTPSTKYLIFRLTLGLVLLAAISIIIFQIKLIKNSVGEIKKRLIMIFLGQILSFISVFFVARVPIEILSEYLGLTALMSDLMFIGGIVCFFSGFLIMFLAAYGFPPFLEFEWKSNISKLFIINQKNNNCLYSSDFTNYGENFRTFLLY